VVEAQELAGEGAYDFLERTREGARAARPAFNG